MVSRFCRRFVRVAIDSVKEAIEEDGAVEMIGQVVVVPQLANIVRGRFQQNRATIERGNKNAIACHNWVGDVQVPLRDTGISPKLMTISGPDAHQRFGGKD